MPPADVTVECADDVPAPVMLTANDTCEGDITVSPVPDQTEGDCDNDFVMTRTWTFTDACGNSSSVTQKITVKDTTPPTVDVVPTDTLVACEGDVPPPPVVTATDNCDEVVAVAAASGINNYICKNQYQIERTWTFTDSCGNSTKVSQIITIKDTIAPVPPAAPNDTTVACADEVPVQPVLVATDNCDGSITGLPGSSTTPGACPNKFVINRSWTFTDSCGNTSVLTQTITVNDTIAPGPGAPIPADMTVACGPVLPGPAIPSVDNCDPTTLSFPSDSIVPGACPNKYVVIRKWTFTDICGNSSSASQTITVNDTIAPVPPPAPADVTVTCAFFVPPAPPLVATDNCDGPVPGVLVPTVTPGGCSDNFVLVRKWTFTDICGNSSSVSQTITVKDTIAPLAPPPPPGVTVACPDDIPPAGPLVAIDNCGDTIVATPTGMIMDGPCPNKFMMIRTWTFTDSCGNTSSVTQKITVNDSIAPEFPNCEDLLFVEVAVDSFCVADTSPASLGIPIVTDNCDDTVKLSYEDIPIDEFCPGFYEFIRFWTAMDSCGNTSFCEQYIVVYDTIKPVITCPADTTIDCTADTSVASLGMATAVDNCDSNLVITYSDAVFAGNCEGESIIERTWTATECFTENFSTCVQTITVIDTTPPTLTCVDITLECGSETTPDMLYGAGQSGPSGTDSPGQFYSIDPVTGVASAIGTGIGFDRIGGMDIHPVTGLIYATAERPNSDTSVLITIDPSTGVGTEVALLNGGLAHTYGSGLCWYII